MNTNSRHLTIDGSIHRLHYIEKDGFVLYGFHCGRCKHTKAGGQLLRDTNIEHAYDKAEEALREHLLKCQDADEALAGRK